VTPIAVLASVPHVPHVAQQPKRRPPGTFQDQLQISCGTELASAGIDLLALRDLMGHANPETTAAYVRLSPETLAAEYARARAAAQ
jgi:integrase